MATDRREIVITINATGEKGKGVDSNVGKIDDNNNWKNSYSDFSSDLNAKMRKILHPVSSSINQMQNQSSNAYLGIMVAKQMYNSIKEPLKQSITYGIQRNFNLYDNYVMEREFNSVKQSINRGINIGSSFVQSIVGGAMAGSMAGPVGAVIGAVAGGVSSAIGSAFTFANEVAQNKDQAKLKLTTSVITTDYNASRSGYALTNNSQNTYN